MRTMATRTLSVEVPEELVALLGSAEAAAAEARLALVLEMLRQERIGESKAAELLGVTRADLLDLMGEHGVPSGPRSFDELVAEVDAAERILEAH